MLGENKAWVPVMWPEEVATVMKAGGKETGLGVLWNSVMQAGVGNFWSQK